jgi:hypothetical protein
VSVPSSQWPVLMFCIVLFIAEGVLLPISIE